MTLKFVKPKQPKPGLNFSKSDIDQGCLDEILAAPNDQIISLIKKYGNPTIDMLELLDITPIPQIRGRITSLKNGSKGKGSGIFITDNSSRSDEDIAKEFFTEEHKFGTRKIS